MVRAKPVSRLPPLEDCPVVLLRPATVKEQDKALVKERDKALVKEQDRVPVKEQDKVPVKERDKVPVKERDRVQVKAADLSHPHQPRALPKPAAAVEWAASEVYSEQLQA